MKCLQVCVKIKLMISGMCKSEYNNIPGKCKGEKNVSKCV